MITIQKQILVDLKTFLDNGGKLIKDRKIFYHDKRIAGTIVRYNKEEVTMVMKYNLETTLEKYQLENYYCLS